MVHVYEVEEFPFLILINIKQ